MRRGVAQAFWSSHPLPAIALDAADRVQEINPAAEEFLNRSAKAAAGAPLVALLRTEADLAGAAARVRHGNAPLFLNNAEIVGPQGAPLACDFQLAPLAGLAGGVLVIVEMRDRVRRLDRAQSVRNAARSAIGMGEMLAHEIKNPLAGIKGAAQLLAMDLGAKERKLTNLIVAEASRITALLDQVEQFGDLRPPRRRTVNIHDLLDRARRSAALGHCARMRFVENFDPSLPPTFVDGDQMLQVFLNLMKNAAEAAGGGGTISMSTYYEPFLRMRLKNGVSRVLPLQIEIADDGPGIAPELVADVFEPFVSGRENGTGLGLALVSKIVAEHDAWIALETRPGRTVFRLSLPVAQPGDPAAGPASEGDT